MRSTYLAMHVVTAIILLDCGFAPEEGGGNACTSGSFRLSNKHNLLGQHSSLFAIVIIPPKHT